MKKIKFTCPHCASVLRVPGHLAGVSGPCPKCAVTITAPFKSEESTMEVIPAGSGTAIATAIAGTESGNRGSSSATATLPPPVKPLQESRQPVVQEPNTVQSEYAATPVSPPPPVPVERAAPPIPVPPPPTVPSQYEEPDKGVAAAPGNYAEPILRDPEPETVQEKPAAMPPPLVDTEPEQVAPINAPLEEMSVPPPVLEEPVPHDIVEPDISAPILPPTLEPGIPVGEPLVPPAEEEPKSEVPVIAIPKTQPIQMKTASTVMPPDRNEVEIEPTPPPGPAVELPRLDVSLADAEPDAAADLQQYQQKEPTRIQLSQFDEGGAAANSLDDFTREPAAEMPESNTEPSNTEAIPLPPEDNLEYAPPSPAVEIAMPVTEAPASFVPPDSDTALALEQQLMQELSAPHPSSVEVDQEDSSANVDPAPEIQMEQAPQELEVTATEEEEAVDSRVDGGQKPWIEQPDLHEPEETSPTDEGSMANMLGGAGKKAEQEMSADLGLEPVLLSENKVANEPLIDPTLPEEEPTPAPLTPVSRTESNEELDVFDELLGKSSPDGKVGPPWVIMGAIVASVAILATLMGIFVWHAFGGGAEPIAEQDKELLDQKYSIISSGSSKDSSAEKLKAVNSLDMSLPDKKENDAPAIEKSVEPPLVVNEDAKSSITLPGDGSRVMISDGSGAKETRDSPPASLGSIPGAEQAEKPAGLDKIPDPVVKVPRSVETAVGAGNNKISELDQKIAKMGDNVDTAIDDAPAIQDPPAQFKPTDVGSMLPSKIIDSSVSFPAPGKDDPPLGQSREVIETFIRAPDWQSRIPFTYQGESLRPKIEDYYKKWAFSRADKFSVQLFQMEQDTTLGGPYWVYLVSTSDTDAGFPVIVRVEDGNLKVDWEIYSEFQDKHFVRFRDGTIASPHSFRVVLEQKSDYFGEDRDQFKDRGDYLCFEVSPPYGNPGEFSQYAFVKKGSALATEINQYIGLGEDLLAVVVTLDYKKFPHGKRHMVITKWITEGWFQ